MTLSTMPASWVRDAARLAGRLMYRLDRRHRRRALFNIRLALCHLPPPQAERLALRSLQHCSQTFLAMAVLTRSASEERLRRITGVTPDAPPPPAAVTAPGPTIFVTGHVGNWELLGLGLCHMGVPLHAVARIVDNPRIDRWTVERRRYFGIRMVARDDLAAMHRVMRAGGALGFITDQNAGERGAFVPFFGRLASAHRGPGALAVYYDARVVCGCARHLGAGLECKMECTDVIRPKDYRRHRDPVYYVTARIQRAIENVVRRWPQQYLWIHRRWKSRPPHEARRRPMPDRLRKQLLSLPWMTEDLMAELAKPVDVVP
jgi:KDO2-lipid IV(A) lauroyltransferase